MPGTRVTACLRFSNWRILPPLIPHPYPAQGGRGDLHCGLHTPRLWPIRAGVYTVSVVIGPFGFSIPGFKDWNGGDTDPQGCYGSFFAPRWPPSAASHDRTGPMPCLPSFFLKSCNLHSMMHHALISHLVMMHHSCPLLHWWDFYPPSWWLLLFTLFQDGSYIIRGDVLPFGSGAFHHAGSCWTSGLHWIEVCGVAWAMWRLPPLSYHAHAS